VLKSTGILAVDVMTEKNLNPKEKQRRKNIVETSKENEEKFPTGKETKENTKQEPKKPIQKKPVVKKEFALVNIKGVPISTKYSIAICKFIKNKKIDEAINYLEQVILKKKAMPMKGEIPHRKGKGMMSGRFPKRASEEFIKILKSLKANANANGLEEPIIVDAIANFASRPYGRFGRTKKKRTHIQIKCKERKNGRKKNSSN